MATAGKARYWIVWAVGSIGLAAALGYVLFDGADKTLFMPGPLSPGHHQLAESCDSCHLSPLGGGEVLQQACVECHGSERVKPHDSHPRAKFTDPRNADRLQKIDALSCVSCHVEHRPEITDKDGLTRPRDLCFHCHAEIGEERPSHRGMEFESCTSSGCHNYHNNRALYTDFLVKHMDDPETRAEPRVPLREFASVLDEIIDYPHDAYPVERLTRADADAPAEHLAAGEILDEWAATAHAAAGVNCSACHQPRDASGEPAPWTDRPGQAGCNSCHGSEAKRFGQGKHGMRLAAGLGPMRPELALLPMHSDAAHRELDCQSCHGSHGFDVVDAAVEACLACHDDRHSLAYRDSPHHELWLAETSGAAAPGSGVSCATCHMPRIDFDVNDYLSRTLVDHNQSASLSPNSKMIRPACLHCHGLGFALNALADRNLIDANFTGRPAVHVDSIDLARADLERALRERAAAGN